MERFIYAKFEWTDMRRILEERDRSHWEEKMLMINVLNYAP
jgi:hypothetical protein